MTDDLHQRARAVFLELSTLDGPVASGELDRLVGDDAALRAAVFSLLDARQNANEAGLMTAETASRHSAPITESAGTVIGPYKILQLIGEGGFGSVFLAEQAEPVRRRVALKIIKLGMDTKQVIARFEAERQALALMDHPHIARVFDAGSTDSGRPYFAMEYVVGDAITKFADDYKLDIDARLKLLAQVCSAVQHAHTKGVIHRDLKPANVLVSMVDGKPFAKVIDFGIAKATASPLTHKTLFTEHRQLIGTPEYMSPEQAEGSPDIDTRTDVYALGVLLYELLTGATPFDATRLRSAAWAEMQRIIREEEPPIPSMRLSRDAALSQRTAANRQTEPPRLTNSIRGELDWIVMKALDKDRGRRYSTPLELAEDIGKHLSGDAVEAAPPSAGYRLRKFVQRNKRSVIAGSSVAAVLVFGIAGTTTGLIIAQHNARVAIHNADLAARANDELQRQSEIATASIEDAVKRIHASDLSLDASPRLPGESDWVLSPTWSSRRTPDGSWGPGEFALNKTKPTDDNKGVTVPLEPDEVLPALAEYLSSTLNFAIDANEQLATQRDEAQWSAYTANLALAQNAMDAGDWLKAREYLAACPESKRGWEWQFMQLHAASITAEFPGAGNVVSHDGSIVLSARDQWVRLFSSKDGMLIREFRIDDSMECHGGRFSGDNSVAVAVARLTPRNDLTAKFPYRTLRLPVDPKADIEIMEGTVAALNFDGSKIALYRGDQSGVYTPDGELICLTPDADSVNSHGMDMHFLSEDRAVVGLADDGMRIWPLDGATPVVLAASEPLGNEVRVSPGGGLIAANTARGIAVWDSRGEFVFEDSRRGQEPDNVTWSDDGSFLISRSWNAPFLAWSNTGTPLKSLPSHEVGGNLYAYIAPRSSVVATSMRSGIVLTDVLTGATQRIPLPSDFGAPIAFTPDGLSMAILLDGELRHLDLHGNVLAAGSIDLGKYMGLDGLSETSAFVYDGSDAGYAGGLSIVRLPFHYTRQRLKLPREQAAIYAGSICNDNPADRRSSAASTTLADGSRTVTAEGRTLVFSDTASGRELLSIPLALEAESVQTSPNSDRVVVTFNDGSLEVFDTRSPLAQSEEMARENLRRTKVRQTIARLLESDLPTNELIDAVISNSLLTPQERWSAHEVLVPELMAISQSAQQAFETLTRSAASTEQGRAAVAAADLPRRIRDIAMELATAWEYRPPRASREEIEKASEWWEYTSNIMAAANNPQHAQSILDQCPEHLRGWEWHYLSASSRSGMLLLGSGNSEAFDLAMSPDGSLTANAYRGGQKEVQVRRITTGEVVATLPAPGGSNSVAFSPDSTKLLILGRGSAVSWNIATGNEAARLPVAETTSASGTFSPDGTRILTYAWARRPEIWNATTGELLARIPLEMEGEKAKDGLGDAAFSADGSQVITAHFDHAKLWDSVTGQLQQTLRCEDEQARDIRVASDGKSILGFGFANEVVLWDADSGEVRTKLALKGTRGAAGAQFSPSGERIVTYGYGRGVRVWDSATGTLLRDVPVEHPDGQHSAAFSPDGSKIVVWGVSSPALIDIESGEQLHELAGQHAVVNNAAFSPDGEAVLTSSVDGTTRLWTPKSQNPITWRVFDGEEYDNFVTYLQFSHDSKHILSAAGRQWREWHLASRSIVREHSDQPSEYFAGYDQHAAYISDGNVLSWFDAAEVTESPDSENIKTLVPASPRSEKEGWEQFPSQPIRATSTSGDAVLTATREGYKIVDANTGEFLLVAEVPGSTYSEIAHQGDRVLSVVFEEAVVRVSDAANGEMLYELPGQMARFDPSGSRILTLSRTNDGARIWDARSGKLICSLHLPLDQWENQHTTKWHYWQLAHRFLDACAFSPDGMRIVFPREQREVGWTESESAFIYDTSTGKQLAELRARFSVLSRIAFSPDGTRIATSQFVDPDAGDQLRDSGIRLWNAESGLQILHLQVPTLDGYGICSIAWNPDGSKLAAGGHDGQVTIFDATQSLPIDDQ